jgi:hypothetical protein
LKPPTTDDEKEDRLLRDLMIEQGAGGLPEILSEEEIDACIRRGEIELFRGLSGNLVYCDQFREGLLFVGCGLRANGIYSAYGENALKTAMAYGPFILRMSLKAEANVITYDEIIRLFEDAKRKNIIEIGYLELLPRIKIIERILAKKKDYKIIILSDLGRFAVISGYDAIDIRDVNEMVILNRTMVRVQNVNVR